VSDREEGTQLGVIARPRRRWTRQQSFAADYGKTLANSTWGERVRKALAESTPGRSFAHVPKSAIIAGVTE
jgi:hypothetical protein